jgi:hypothetical protein
MNKRSKKKVSAKEEQIRYDTFWNQKDFMATKTTDVTRVSPKIDLSVSSSQNKKQSQTPMLAIDKKFVLTSCLEEMEANLSSLGQRTLGLFEDITDRHIELSKGLKREVIARNFSQCISRFLVLSRSYGWDKKYRPSRLDQVRLL